LDAMQTDYYSLYERYFAPRGIAMLTIDMPSVGFFFKMEAHPGLQPVASARLKGAA
ncbi:alpha/beta hydrolase, partial [Staphylococcus sp. S36]|nr:alpha/beta hydrolase [Staphylococcus sp. S36]